MLEQLALWLATYALHSTLLLLSAWWLARVFPAARERLWRLALFGGLLTATLHAGGYLPRVAYLQLPGLTPAADVTATMEPQNAERATTATRGQIAAIHPSRADRTSAAARVAGGSSIEDTVKPSRLAPVVGGATDGPVAARGQERAAVDDTRAVAGAIAHQPVRARWWSLAAIAWLGAVAVSIVALAYRSARFHWRFLARRRSARGQALRLLDDLARRAEFRRRVRLTLADSVRVPMARGWLRPEICLPPALEDRLESEELEAALAHELAHLERRDPLWRAVTRLVASALPFQPLNGLACRALEDEAELRCDDRAAALTGRPAALARCLTKVASWTAADRSRVALPALAADGSNLKRRVLRLLEQPPRRSAPWWAHALAVVPSVAVLAFAPGLGAAPTRDAGSPGVTRPAAASAAPASRIDDSNDAAQSVTAPVVHRLAVPTFEAIRPGAPDPPQAPEAPEALEAPEAPLRRPEPPAAPIATAAPADPECSEPPPAPVAPEALAPPAAPAAFAIALAEDPLPARVAGPPPVAVGDDDEEERNYVGENGDDEDYDDDQDYDEDEDYEASEKAEHLEAVAEEIDRLMEDVDDRIEMAMAVVEEAFGQELDAVEEEIDGQVESFDDEIERSLAPLEQALEELAEELEEATENGNERRAAMLERQMSDIGAAMGDLGGRLGGLVSESVLTGVDRHLQTLTEAHGRTVQSYAQKQADLGLRLAREIEERQRSGQGLDDEEIQALEEELEAIAEEAAPHYEELERQVEELTRQLEPTREQMRTLSVELRREVDAWRSRHAALLHELEEDGITVPSYGEEPSGDDDSGSDSEADEPDA